MASESGDRSTDNAGPTQSSVGVDNAHGEPVTLNGFVMPMMKGDKLVCLLQLDRDYPQIFGLHAFPIRKCEW